MPTPSTYQTNGMKVLDGMVPQVDGDGFIVNMAYKPRVVAKAANYTVLATESGTIFTTTGATGAVTFTLPAPAAGLIYTFFNTVDQNMTVAGAVDDKIITFNDLDADSVSFSTAGNKIGACVQVVSDGTSWLVMPMGSGTMTVDT
jgi:hypothetical protein